MAESGFIPVCWFCKHFNAVQVESGQLSRFGSFSCEAYPDGIPYEVFEGTINHQYSYLDDNGIRFEKRDKTMQLEKMEKFLEAVGQNSDEYLETMFKYFVKDDTYYRTEKGQQEIRAELAMRRKWGIPD
jgi:hypothetical protein